MGIKKNIIWLIAIILMAVFSFSAYPQGEENLPDETDPIQSKAIEKKSKKVKPDDKKPKKDSKPKNEKKANVETDVEIEYELLNEPEKLLYGWGYEIYSKQIPREGL